MINCLEGVDRLLIVSGGAKSQVIDCLGRVDTLLIVSGGSEVTSDELFRGGCLPNYV